MRAFVCASEGCEEAKSEAFFDIFQKEIKPHSCP